MLSYILRRLAATIPVMLIVAVLVFLMLRLTPGDPAAIIAGDNANTEQVALIRVAARARPADVRAVLHLARQHPAGRFRRELLLQEDRRRADPRPARADAALALFTIVIAVVVAVPLGVLAAYKQGTWIDRIVMGFSVMGFSVPVFVIGYALIYLFAIKLSWVPVQGYQPIAAGLRRLHPAPDPALGDARRDLHRAHRPHDPRERARGARRGLHPHRPRQGPGRDQDPVPPRAQERRRADRHGDRPRRRAPDRRRRRDRERLHHSGARAPHRRRGAGARLPDHPGGDPAVLADLRPDQPRRRPRSTRCSTRGSAIERRARHPVPGPAGRAAAARRGVWSRLLRNPGVAHRRLHRPRHGRRRPCGAGARHHRTLGDQPDLPQPRARRRADDPGRRRQPAPVHALDGHRLARPRHLQPRPLRRARVDPRRHHRRGHQHRGRSRRSASSPAMCAGSTGSSCGFMDGLMAIPAILLAIALVSLFRAGLAERDRRDRRAGDPARRAARALDRAVGARGALCRGGDHGRHADAAAAHTPRPAQHRRAADRAGHLHLRLRDPDRGDPVLPRRRHPARDADLGQHHGRGALALPHLPAQHPVPRRLPRPDRARREHARRRLRDTLDPKMARR